MSDPPTIADHDTDRKENHVLLGENNCSNCSKYVLRLTRMEQYTIKIFTSIQKANVLITEMPTEIMNRTREANDCKKEMERLQREILELKLEKNRTKKIVCNAKHLSQSFTQWRNLAKK